MRLETCSCTAPPAPSWLTLEQYRLGELAADAQRRVESHLEGCACCRACLEQIDAGRELPPLPAVQPRRSAFWRSRRARLALAGGLAAAAALLLVLLSRTPPAPPRGAVPPRSLASYKGGELTISLVRQRRGAITQDPERFVAGDRFKVLVTCPPLDPPLGGRVVVFQGGSAAFPLPPAFPLPCGNRKPLPGAFTIDGPAAQVCLVVGDSSRELARRRLSRPGPAELPADLDVVCTTLLPGRD